MIVMSQPKIFNHAFQVFPGVVPCFSGNVKSQGAGQGEPVLDQAFFAGVGHRAEILKQISVMVKLALVDETQRRWTRKPIQLRTKNTQELIQGDCMQNCIYTIAESNRLGNEFLRRAFNCRHWWQDSGENASRRPAAYKTSNCCEMRPGIVQPIHFLMILIVSYCFLMLPPGETISPWPFLSCPLQITIRKCTRSSCQKASKRRRFFSSKMWPSSCSEIWPSKLCDCRRILIARKWLQQTVRADLSVLLRIVRESNQITDICQSSQHNPYSTGNRAVWY